MSKKVFLTLCCLLVSLSCFGYDLILKNGKVINGTLVSENDSTIVIRDSHGVIISVRRANLDTEATNRANILIPIAAPEEKKQSHLENTNTPRAVVKEKATTSGRLAVTKEEAAALIKKYQDQTSDPEYAERVKVEQKEWEKEKAKRESAKREWQQYDFKKEKKRQAQELAAKVKKTDGAMETLKSNLVLTEKIAYCKRTKPDYGQSWVVNQTPNPDGSYDYPTAPTQSQIEEIARWEAECGRLVKD